MPAECALSLDNVTVVPRAFFVERITRLGPERLSEVCAALAIATGSA
jgi:mRNA-degrading endonuclease toxin of MazEF toxin-antitoxin module